jgi:hypothetical protein
MQTAGRANLYGTINNHYGHLKTDIAAMKCTINLYDYYRGAFSTDNPCHEVGVNVQGWKEKVE